MILVVGVLGVATLADVANRTSALADDRSRSTGIARRVAEAARSLTTTELTAAELLPALMAASPGLPDSTPADASQWTTTQRGSEYLISVGVCTVDDAGDGYAPPAARDSTYCAQPAATTPADLEPDDYRRVTLSVSNRRRPTESVRQFTDVSSGASSSLPLVTGLRMRQGGSTCATSCTITDPAQSQAVFDATTTNTPYSIEWLIDGRPKASCPPTTTTCSGSGNDWTFSWNLAPIQTETVAPNVGYCRDPNVPGATWFQLDGVYQVGVRGYDRTFSSGGAASLTTVLNRCPGGVPPQGLNATGRDTGGPVDVEWRGNQEGDVIGYRVFRSTSDSLRTPVCPPTISDGEYVDLSAAKECLDTNAPDDASRPLYYGVHALDRDPVTGVIREGAVSVLDVNSANQAPNAIVVDSLTATRSATGTTLNWSIPALDQQDPDHRTSSDRHASFRVYRRSGETTSSPGLADRYDRELISSVCSSTSCTWIDTAPLDTASAYWIRAVDDHLRESAFSAGTTA